MSFSDKIKGWANTAKDKVKAVAVKAKEVVTPVLDLTPCDECTSEEGYHEKACSKGPKKMNPKDMAKDMVKEGVKFVVKEATHAFKTALTGKLRGVFRKAATATVGPTMPCYPTRFDKNAVLETAESWEQGTADGSEYDL